MPLVSKSYYFLLQIVSQVFSFSFQLYYCTHILSPPPHVRATLRYLIWDEFACLKCHLHHVTAPLHSAPPLPIFWSTPLPTCTPYRLPDVNQPSPPGLHSLAHYTLLALDQLFVHTVSFPEKSFPFSNFSKCYGLNFSLEIHMPKS